MFLNEKPIDMLIFCPNCGLQHIDAPNESTGWDNPPHKSHMCLHCGRIWRHADVPTNGVAKIKTMGKDDNWANATVIPGRVPWVDGKLGWLLRGYSSLMSIGVSWSGIDAKWTANLVRLQGPELDGRVAHGADPVEALTKALEA